MRAVASPPRHQVRLVRSPPPARCPLRVRTPALVSRALLRPASRSVPRRAADARSFHERSAARVPSRPWESTDTPNGTPGEGNIARRQPHGSSPGTRRVQAPAKSCMYLACTPRVPKLDLVCTWPGKSR